MRLISIFILCLFCTNLYSQTLEGPRVVDPASSATYTINWGGQNPKAGIRWDLDGGYMIQGGDWGVEIQWITNQANFFTGRITFYDANGNYLGDFVVLVGVPYLTPNTQVIPYGANNGSICLNTGLVTPSNVVWQQSPDNDTWTDINDHGTCVSIPVINRPMYYRCYFDIDGDTYFTDFAYVDVTPLGAGSITLSGQPAYNTHATINTVPATGGYCYTSDYQYVWEQSVDGDPWVTIGNGEAYPASSPPITGQTLLRRSITCGGQTLYTNTIEIKPFYTSVDYENRNYVRTNTITTRGIKTWIQADQLDAGKKVQETVYFDGLGRPIQTVEKGITCDANGTWKDVVSFTNYDKLGRPVQNNLPYPTASEPGKFKTNTAEQQTFYSTSFNEPSPWGKTEYQDNPLDVVKKVIEPGDYRLNNDKGKSIDYDYNNSNNITENVHVWRIGYTTGIIPSTSLSDVYQTGSLLKVVLTDENGKQVIEYRDNNENVVLKKVQLKEINNGLTNEHDGWLCTYYVFDDFNHLRFVITPKAVAYLDANSWQLTQQIANELCFAYEYDGRGRTISEKKPGVAKTSMLYDTRDRVVFTQDGNETSKEWKVLFYDDLNRMVEKGIYTTTKTAGDLQTDITKATISTTITIGGQPTSPFNLPVTGARTTSSPSQYIAANSIEFDPDFSSYDGDEFVAEIEPFVPGSYVAVNVLSNVQPPVDVNNPAVYKALAYNYYDDYNFAGVKKFNTSYNNLQAYSASEPDVEPIVKTDRTRGLATGSKVRILNTSTFLNTTIYYDEDASVLQTLGENIKSGTDIVTLQRHFDGRVMSSYTQHGLPGGVFDGFGILTKYIFDKVGRLVTLQKKYGNVGFKDISTYQYNELGKLMIRKLGNKPNSTGPLESLTYNYNANGVLTGINKDYALSTNNIDQWNNYFGLYLGYENFDNQFTNARFDNLITGAIWKSQGDNTPRKFDYTYDNANRYTSANFTQKGLPSETIWSNAKADFSETNIEYDENGNLKKLYRKGMLAGNASPVEVDKLNYTYKQVAGGEWSNQLLQVFDNNPSIGAAANGNLGDFKDEVFGVSANDYTYDNNGNLLTDNNKKIRNGGAAGITYNIFNKPDKIVIENKSTVEFTYDATGARLAKKVTPVSGTAKTTYYLGEFIYEDNDLQYILNEEGRVRVMDRVSSTSPLGAASQVINGNILLNGGKWGVFDYFIKDQTGSTRMVITEETHLETFKCTMEDAAKTEEEPIFGMVDNNGNPLASNEVKLTRRDNSGYISPNGWASNSSQKVSKLFTTGAPGANSVGPNVLLKVMAGDYINATANYYYDVPPSNVTNTSILNTIVTSVIGGFTSSSVNQAVKNAGNSLQATMQDPVNSPLLPFLNNQPAQAPDRPKAYLNYIFFDENFNYVPNEGGVDMVKANDNEDMVSVLNKRAPKNGYVYVYLSNESNWSVYFDDFTVSHERGAIIEESHYYPHGMKMSAISSHAFNKPLNKYGYQGEHSEEEEESGYDEFDLRTYDAQIGRWIQPDPYDEFASGYVGMSNDPVNVTDPTGGLEFRTPPLGWTNSILDANIFSNVLSMIFPPENSVSTELLNQMGSGILAANTGGKHPARPKPPREKWKGKIIDDLSCNALEGLKDPDRSCNMCCLNALASNLSVLYDEDDYKIPTNGNLTDAVGPLVKAKLAVKKNDVAPTLNGERQTSKNGDFRNEKTTTNIPDALEKAIGKKTGVFTFAVGIAGQYHSTIIVVVNDGHNIGDDKTGWLKATKTDPVFILYEDGGGVRMFRKNDLDKKLMEWYIGGAEFYNGKRDLGVTPGDADDKSLDATIYQLYRR